MSFERDDIPKDVEQYIGMLQDRIAFLENELQGNQQTVLELKQELNEIERTAGYGKLERLAEKLQQLSELADSRPDHDLSAVRRQLELARKDWDENLPDDPTDLLENYDP